jgi:hypothetical protein
MHAELEGSGFCTEWPSYNIQLPEGAANVPSSSDSHRKLLQLILRMVMRCQIPKTIQSAGYVLF